MAVVRPVTAEPMLDVRGVWKSFPTDYSVAAWLRNGARRPRKDVLHGIDLRVQKGELFGLLGANGAGKTTLLKMLATLVIPDRGTILIDGIDVMVNPMQAKRRIGLCTSEERSFYFRLTGRQNLQFFAGLAGLNGSTARRRIDAVTHVVDLRDALDEPVERFSTGMRQRLILARALLSDPDVLFLDEPTRAVDPIHAEEMRSLIKDRLVRDAGKTAILATNLLDEAWSTCDRVAIMRAGTVVAVGAPGELHGLLGETRSYALRVDRANDALLDAVRRAVIVRRLELTSSAGAVDLVIELVWSATSLTALVQALARTGTVLHAFHEVKREPMETFKQLIGAGDDG
jgi:ABC-2 type transport system ATP-binding protein